MNMEKMRIEDVTKALAISEKRFLEYKEKVKELVNEEKAEDIKKTIFDDDDNV